MYNYYMISIIYNLPMQINKCPFGYSADLPRGVLTPDTDKYFALSTHRTERNTVRSRVCCQQGIREEGTGSSLKVETSAHCTVTLRACALL